MLTPTCPECGAPEVDGMDCWWLMGAVCGWEHDDPALAALHFHTVASYNLQHPSRFTEEALSGLRSLFCQAIDENLPGPEIRRRAGHGAEGAQRVLRRDPPDVAATRAWPLTIADVYASGESHGAAARVQAWAAAIRATL